MYTVCKGREYQGSAGPGLIFTDILAIPTDNKRYIAYFHKKIGFDISCELSPMETICMKCQSIFSEKSKKTISTCCLLEFQQMTN